ncbi:MAG TPA: hypothetical protein VHZ56_13365 [Devosia sp.]|jgi:hypothetical protein|nr:hypothetical protein [Devosia sp.]
MAKNKSDAKGKKGDKKGKKGKGSADGISVAGHPHAAAQVRRAKGFGGVSFFLITAYFSFKAGVPADQVAVRALIAGIGGYLLAWMCAVTVWRQLVLAELRTALESGRARMEPVAAGAPAGDKATPADGDGK